VAEKLYLVTRKDLPPNHRAVQLAHSLHAFEEAHRVEYVTWRTQSQTLALLEAENELELRYLLELAERRGIPAAPFHEPDRDDELTAVAFGPTGRRLLSRLPCALRSGRDLSRRIEQSSKV